ncbi:hypothetical protein ATANTOWER_007064 [Ataeniobius toweri]|uniref:Uncharacterized protein n=1 Tax=Ataeniobius toweri TaxID=208326 RepID=A0ABU7A4U2_9TELE|nr:hypothetical protein [Ataeniobius toweri]
MSPNDISPSRLASPASWASLRSPGASSRPLSSQHPSHSDSTLATGSSDGSLQATLDEGLSFSICPPQQLDLPVPLLCPVPSLSLHPRETATADPEQSLLNRWSSALALHANQRKQRSHSSSGIGSTSPGCPQQDSMEPSDEEVGTGTGRDGCRQALYSEHLSETLNSLSLTSLLTPGALAPTVMKKCNSTGSLDQSNLSARGKDGRHLCANPHGFLSNPWTEGREKGPQEDSNVTGFSMKSSTRHINTSSRKKR